MKQRIYVAIFSLFIYWDFAILQRVELRSVFHIRQRTRKVYGCRGQNMEVEKTQKRLSKNFTYLSILLDKMMD